MHLENIAVYAALVYAVAIFYRRLLGDTWIAGLAAAFYAIDPGHAQSSSLIAGRNTMLAPLFGVVALVAHDRARRGAWKPGVAVGAALFGASLLAGESGLATGLYLFAYALCLDPAPVLARRLRALAPHAIVAVAWLVAYKLLHAGARGSGMYTDPGHDTLQFLRQAVLRAPISLHGQLGLPTASLFSALSQSGIVVLSIVGVLFCALCARVSWPALREDPVLRFFGVGMLLSVLPICAIIPNDRVLFFLGLGGLGLVARFVATALAGPIRASFGHRALAVFFVVVHGPLAALLYLANTQLIEALAGVSREPLDAILGEPAVAGQTVVFVNAPAQFLISHLAAMRLGTSKPIPLRVRALATGVYPLQVTRTSARALAVRVDGGGLLQPPGTWNVEGEARSPAVSTSYGAQYFAQIVRRVDDPMRAGDTLALTGVTLEVREVTPEGRPVEVRFTFDEPLESPSLRWLQWEKGGYVDFALPPIGATVKLAPASMTPG